MTSEDGKFMTVNYLLATYLQTKEGGGHKIAKTVVIKPGKARFYFDIKEEEGREAHLRFVNSVCSEFESLCKHTIDLCYS